MTRRLASVVACLLALVPLTSAQGSVRDQSTWTDGNGNVTKVQVSDRPDGKVDVTFIDATGFTTAATGTRGPGQTPSATYTPQIGVTTAGGTSYRVRDPIGPLPCYVEQKKPGQTWCPMRPTRKKIRWQRPPHVIGQGLTFGPGEEGTSNPGGPQSL